MLLSANIAAEASPVTGDWEYISAKPDAVYGEPEKLILSLQVSGKKVCGTYMSVYRGGMKVAEGQLHGTVNDAQATVTYEAGWGSITGEGVARLHVRGQQLEWLVTRPGPEPDYMLRSAKLHRSQAKLEKPAKCE